MTEVDIQQAIEEFRIGAKNAKATGFDGVVIHGANGYLIDQFLRSNSNKRTDQYGGTKQKRTRFLIEVRQKFSNTIITTGNYTPERGQDVIEKQLVDLVGFGRKILANPDYPKRVAQNAPLNEITNTHTLFGGGAAEGYTDYPFFAEQL